MTKLAPEWVRTSDPVIRSPARYRWTTVPARFDQKGHTICMITLSLKNPLTFISTKFFSSHRQDATNKKTRVRSRGWQIGNDGVLGLFVHIV